MHTRELAGEVFFALCKTIDSPIALGAWLRYKYSHAELASMELNPCDYTSVQRFREDYAVVSFFAKYKGLNTGVNLDEVALRKFTLAEDQCKETNLRLKDQALLAKTRFGPYIHMAQRKIARLLGPLSLFKITDRYGWGPGASVDIKRRRSQIDTKLCEIPLSVSRSSRSMLRNEIGQDLHWSASILGQMPEGPFSLTENVFKVYDACRIETVPKNAKTNRVIAVEPRGNSFLQKGVGAFIRNRLRTVGINLDDQTVNQDLARRAFSEGLATLDLSAASDTIAIECVYSLLPYEWWSLMDSLRSRSAILPSKETIRLNKFSSMGNGFTFELETLIFWALAQSVSDEFGGGVVAVYGDDIIVESGITSDLCLLLQFMGFTVNDQKSFFSGSFYESCGKHFFEGHDVTPAYQKETLDGPQQVIRCGNRLIRLGIRMGSSNWISSKVRPAWNLLRRTYSGPLTYRPLGLDGDDAWALPESEYPPSALLSKDKNGWDGILSKVIPSKQIRLPANESALLAWSMRRGVVTEVPYLGDVTIDTEPSKLTSVSRRVIPAGEFSLSFGQ